MKSSLLLYSLIFVLIISYIIWVIYLVVTVKAQTTVTVSVPAEINCHIEGFDAYITTNATKTFLNNKEIK